jgi:hypothetical protein
MELRTELRRLHHMIKDSSQNCDSCKRRNSLELKHVAVQTYEVKNDEAFLMAGGGGSGIIRVRILIYNSFKCEEINLKEPLWFFHNPIGNLSVSAYLLFKIQAAVL